MDKTTPAIKHTVYVRRDGYLVKVEMHAPPLSREHIEDYHDYLKTHGYEPATLEDLEMMVAHDAHTFDMPRQQPMWREDDTAPWDAPTNRDASATATAAPPLPQTIICPDHHVAAELRTAKDGSGDQWYSHKESGTTKWHRINP